MDVREKLVELLADAGVGKTERCFLADQLISNGVTVQEWISVKDRLPEETGRYLVVKKRIAPDAFGGSRTDIVILRFFEDSGFKMPKHIPDWIN